MNSNPLPRFRLQFPKSNTGRSLSRSGKSLPGGKVTHGHPEQPHKLPGFSKTPTPPWPLFQQSGNELTAEKLRRSRRAQAVLPGPLFGCSSFGDPGWKRALWGCKVRRQGLSPSACMCNQTPGPNRHVLTWLLLRSSSELLLSLFKAISTHTQPLTPGSGPPPSFTLPQYLQDPHGDLTAPHGLFSQGSAESLQLTRRRPEPHTVPLPQGPPDAPSILLTLSPQCPPDPGTSRCSQHPHAPETPYVPLLLSPSLSPSASGTLPLSLCPKDLEKPPGPSCPREPRCPPRPRAPQCAPAPGPPRALHPLRSPYPLA